jgi:CHAD domain-containing protein
MEALLDLKTSRAIKIIILEQLRVARSNLKHLVMGKDTEGLHNFRVSIRRMRVWISFARKGHVLTFRKSERKHLKKLVQITNAARDLEVHLSIFNQHLTVSKTAPEVMEIRLDWEQKITKSYRELEREVPKIFAKIEPKLKETLGSMGKNSEQLRMWLKPVLCAQAAKLDRFVKAIKSADDDKKCHFARLQGKALRYLLEPITMELNGAPELLKELRRLQDLIGGIRDGQMLAAKLDASAAFRSAKRSNDAEVRYLFRELKKGYLGDKRTRFADKVKGLF